MLVFFLNFYRTRLARPSFFFSIGESVYRLRCKLQGIYPPIDFNRIKLSNRLKDGSHFSDESPNYELKLIIVATNKDFDVLGSTLTRTLESLSNFKNVIVNLVVPRLQVEEAKKIVFGNQVEISVVDEESILDRNFLAELTKTFGRRDTWVYQQSLKLAAVSQSDGEYVMILDADTVLLRKRPWVTASGAQLLCVSDEFNEDYYLFLSQLGAFSKAPDFTFVTHHMLFQTRLVRQMLNELGISNFSDLLDSMIRNADLKAFSPLCIDYELYGQWLSMNNESNFCLVKWSNLGISKGNLELILNSRIRMSILKLLFNSLSFHSWS